MMIIVSRKSDTPKHFAVTSANRNRIKQKFYRHKVTCFNIGSTQKLPKATLKISN